MSKKEGVKALTGAIIAIVISMAVYRTGNYFLDRAMDDFILRSFLAHVLFAVPVTVFLFVLKKTDVFRSDPRTFRANWLSGLLMIILILYNSIGLFGTKITISAFQFILFVIQMFLVGYCEEILFRGFLFNALHTLFGEHSLKGTRLAAIVGGILFGMAHLSNAFFEEISLAAALMQALTAGLLGILICAIYVRTGKCLWYVLALHSLNDFLSFILTGVLSGVSERSAIGEMGDIHPLISLIQVVIFTVVIMIVLRTKKLAPVIRSEDTSLKEESSK